MTEYAWGSNNTIGKNAYQYIIHLISIPWTGRYYLIYLTLHWPFLINPRLCSLSINSYEYSCHTICAGLLNALFIWWIYGKVAQWLKFRAVNHDIMCSNPAETVYFFFSWFLLNNFLSIYCTFSMFLLI